MWSKSSLSNCLWNTTQTSEYQTWDNYSGKCSLNSTLYSQRYCIVGIQHIPLFGSLHDCTCAKVINIIFLLFFQVPSKLLLQVPRFGREFQTYKRIVPELKLDIGELTDTYKKGNGVLCILLLNYQYSSNSGLSFVWGGVNYQVWELWSSQSAAVHPLLSALLRPLPPQPLLQGQS